MATGAFAIADIAIVALIVISAFFGVLRGFVKEVVSLIIWLAALLLGMLFAARAGELIAGDFGGRLQVAVGFAAVFIAVLVAGAILQRLLGPLVESTGLSGTDRTLGLLFGAVRGGVVVIVALIVLRPSVEQNSWWSESQLIPPLLALEGDVRNLFDYLVDTLGRTVAGDEPVQAT